jgi:hypothetical protein
MVRSRHSSLRLPSTTVTATPAPPWSWAGVTSPAGHPSNQASTSPVTSSGTAQGRSGGRSSGAVDSPRTPVPRSTTLPVRGPTIGGSRTGVGMAGSGTDAGPAGSGTGAGSWASRAAGSWASRVVRATRSAGDQAGRAGCSAVVAERMRTSFGVDPGARVAVWRRDGRRAELVGGWTGPGGRLASVGGRSRAPGPGTRAGPLQPRREAGVAAQGGVPVRHGNAGGCRAGRPLSRRHGRGSRLYRIATIPCRSGCRINPVEWGGSAMVLPPLVPRPP